ncbi:GSCOCG00010258001-RA-CDS [Cotesia congregata]|uniref:Uncharacterized protein Cc8L18.3 n=1 Tax=Cotesia congregata TaxID=51543 RepID=B9W4M0_COTCN|nr:GSCOCG00010258001-RA-CDS [Cotesia congregata]CAR82259.1 hypothetical protein [Cotesia congregata]
MNILIHAADSVNVEVRKVVNKIKKNAATADKSMKKIVANAVRKIPSPVAANIPDALYLVKSGRRIRRQLNPVLENPNNLRDFEIPLKYTETSKNDKFLQYDSGGDKRILIYATETNMNILKS